MADQLLLTVKDVALRLRCSQSFVYGLLADGSLKYYALGKGQGAKRISEEQLLAYLKDRERCGDEVPAPLSLRDIKHASAER